jgi:hypothetical protein
MPSPADCSRDTIAIFVISVAGVAEVLRYEGVDAIDNSTIYGGGVVGKIDHMIA